MKLNKKVIIICIIILIILLIICMYFIISFGKILEKSAYIDIWEEEEIGSDISLYSTGSGINEMLYLGAQPVHYLIYKNGDIYTCKESSYQSKIFGIDGPAKIKYIKKNSQSDLEKIENELKLITENNKINSNNPRRWSSNYWNIKIKGKSTAVDVDIQSKVLNKYL